MFTIEFDHSDWLSQFYSEWRQTSKLVNLKISAKARVCDFGQILKMTKTSKNCSFIKKTCLDSNLIIFDWSSSFNSEWREISKLVNLKISANVLVFDFGQNLKMTKTS